MYHTHSPLHFLQYTILTNLVPISWTMKRFSHGVDTKIFFYLGCLSVSFCPLSPYREKLNVSSIHYMKERLKTDRDTESLVGVRYISRERVCVCIEKK